MNDFFGFIMLLVVLGIILAVIEMFPWIIMGILAIIGYSIDAFKNINSAEKIKHIVPKKAMSEKEKRAWTLCIIMMGTLLLIGLYNSIRSGWR